MTPSCARPLAEAFIRRVNLYLPAPTGPCVRRASSVVTAYQQAPVGFFFILHRAGPCRLCGGLDHVFAAMKRSCACRAASCGSLIDGFFSRSEACDEKIQGFEQAYSFATTWRISLPSFFGKPPLHSTKIVILAIILKQPPRGFFGEWPGRAVFRTGTSRSGLPTLRGGGQTVPRGWPVSDIVADTRGDPPRVGGTPRKVR